MWLHKSRRIFRKPKSYISNAIIYVGEGTKYKNILFLNCTFLPVKGHDIYKVEKDLRPSTINCVFLPEENK